MLHKYQKLETQPKKFKLQPLTVDDDLTNAIKADLEHLIAMYRSVYTSDTANIRHIIDSSSSFFHIISRITKLIKEIKLRNKLLFVFTCNTKLSKALNLVIKKYGQENRIIILKKEIKKLNAEINRLKSDHNKELVELKGDHKTTILEYKEKMTVLECKIKVTRTLNSEDILKSPARLQKVMRARATAQELSVHGCGV